MGWLPGPYTAHVPILRGLAFEPIKQDVGCLFFLPQLRNTLFCRPPTWGGGGVVGLPKGVGPPTSHHLGRDDPEETHQPTSQATKTEDQNQ